MNFHRRNFVNMKKAIGTQWTSALEHEGWRHFRVVGVAPSPRNKSRLELMAACDKSVRFWVDVRELKDRAQWQAGWAEGLMDSDAANAPQPQAES